MSNEIAKEFTVPTIELTLYNLNLKLVISSRIFRLIVSVKAPLEKSINLDQFRSKSINLLYALSFNQTDIVN
jgi:hypothetical protein